MERKIVLKIEQCAKLMCKSKQFVRLGLQRGILPFCVALKMSSKLTHYINDDQFRKWIGDKK